MIKIKFLRNYLNDTRSGFHRHNIKIKNKRVDQT